MKRDMELARKILLQAEKNDNPLGWANIEVEGFSDQDISYHIMLLHDAGLLDATNTSSDDGFSWEASSLTWKGHEFLDAARNDTVWRKAIEIAKETAGVITLESLKIGLVLAVKKTMGG